MLHEKCLSIACECSRPVRFRRITKQFLANVSRFNFLVISLTSEVSWKGHRYYLILVCSEFLYLGVRYSNCYMLQKFTTSSHSSNGSWILESTYNRWISVRVPTVSIKWLQLRIWKQEKHTEHIWNFLKSLL